MKLKTHILILLLIPIIATLFQWVYLLPTEKTLEYEVVKIRTCPILETQYLYLLINTLIFLFPFLLSFDQKVAFYKKWKFLFPSIILIAILFIVWDVYFTYHGIWNFNPKYYFNPTKMLGLPLGEWLFFITVPYACIFIYECLRIYIKKTPFKKVVKKALLSLIMIFLILGCIYWGDVYMSGTCFLSAAFTLYRYEYGDRETDAGFLLTYILSWIPFMIFDGALTGCFTLEPIVLYHPTEFSGIRIGSIPLDDSIYSYLLLFLNISLFEGARNVS